jgi:hypothetical protein
VEQFLAQQPERLARLLAQAQTPLKDAAALNATRWALWCRLQETGLPVEAGTGGRTKYNRLRLGCPRRTGWMLPAWAKAPRRRCG